MECQHLLGNSLKIDRSFVKSKKETVDSLKICEECLLKTSPWMCLNCGKILCGRNDKKHALLHSKENEDHNICMSTTDFSVYCYTCDDFVVNDDCKLMADLRQELKDESDVFSETSSNLEEVSSTQEHGEAVSSTSSSCDSGLEESLSGRNLRPRKRTISNTSENNTETPKKKTAPNTKKAVGLRNLGNTCFMNSVLQSLHNIQEFRCFFSALPSLETKAKRPYYSRSIKENLDEVFLVEELRKVLINLNRGNDANKTAISPECLFLVIWKVVPQFRGHRQHDAHEFLRYMLDRLHTELMLIPLKNELANLSNPSLAVVTNSKLSKNYICPPISNKPRNGSSIVTNVFGGSLQSEVRCLVCGSIYKKIDPFLDLSLDIPEKYYKDVDANSERVCDISECLLSFTEVEELADSELYYCNQCKCKQKSTKRFWIRRLPNVLCLHIKRFRWNNFFRTKIDLQIEFPINELDMTQFVLNQGPETRRSNSSSNVFDLAAVIVHHGNGSSCGHYTSFAINNNVWMHFNDQSVKEVTSQVVQECKPYILFYIKRGSNVAASST